jgi:hypothetical protein
MAAVSDLLDAILTRVTTLATTMGNALQRQGFKPGGTAGQVPVKTDGEDFQWSWGEPGASFPDQTGNDGKFLTTNGTAVSWSSVDLSSKADLTGAAFSGAITALNLSGNNTGDQDLSGKADASHSHPASDITDSTALGRAILTAETASAARTELGAGTTGASLFQAESVAVANEVIGVKTAYCSSDLARSNTVTLVNDPVMVLALEANSVYEISGWLEFSNVVTTGYIYRLFFSNALDGLNGSNFVEIALNGGVFVAYSITSSTGIGATTTRTAISDKLVTKIKGSVRTLAACNLSVQWAQAALDAVNPTTRKAGSYLRVVKISP